jgi:hypothetical protein
MRGVGPKSQVNRGNNDTTNAQHTTLFSSALPAEHQKENNGFGELHK